MEIKWVIIWLSLQLAILSYIVTKQAHDKGYLEGRASVYEEWAATPDDGTCFSKGGCSNDTNSKTPKRHSR